MFKYKKKEKNQERLINVNENNNIWIDAENLSKEEVKEISKEFNLDEGLLEDAKDIFESPRVEFDKENKTFYIFSRYPIEKKYDNLVTLPYLIIFRKNFFMTVFNGNKTPFFIEDLRNEKNQAFNTKDKFTILYFILKRINQKYQQEFRKINKEVLQDKANIKTITDKEIERFVDLETVLNEYLNSLIPFENELRTLLKHEHINLQEEEKDELEDIILAKNQLINTGKNILKLIQNIRSAFEIIATNKLNRTVTKLTIITVVLTIPTMVAGLFGMNVPNNWEHSQNAFWWITSFSFLLSIIFIILLKKEK